MKKIVRFFIYGVLVLNLFSCQQQKKVWDIRDYGAIADNKTINTKAIQDAVDACTEAGGGTVTIESGIYISGTILLKDNVILNVAENATLLGSINPNDYKSIDPFVDATGQLRGKCLVGAVDANNIAITGKGTIDGRGDMFTPQKVNETLEALGESEKETQDFKENSLYAGGKVRKFDRPFLVRLVRSINVKLTDIHLRQPAAWTLHFFQCKNFEVDGIDIYSHANKNNDAIDIDSSSDGVIKNCTIDSGDDAICFKTTSPKPSANIEVFDCKISSEWGAIKFGTESMGDFKNISIKNCFIHDTRGGGIKILSADGANIDNILIDNITMENVEMPIFIRLGERRLVYRDAPRQPVGSIDHVTISNITATTRKKDDFRLSPTSGFFFTGTPNHKIGQVKLENIKITLPGGGTEKDAEIVVPENETDYPEFTKLGAVPAYGMYARHITGLDTKNISFTLNSEDKRKEIVLVDVNE
ncbi:glycoside hydrolase family 28 protein [Zobellia amurskyensis]|uniref:Glycoside hydrolase family 28 protein n=1 Tax=Zobellia amurskyensis TaxID=248905 RepID=A0A7X3D0Z9_9FLAO|nr:glycosyl hydrolase family 28 protein [Zobellia amurskyensis]MUH35521.1 glycoside hydrolase family 28 protein [Zobellia amurskyensis]